jgi:hypothetical protein
MHVADRFEFVWEGSAPPADDLHDRGLAIAEALDDSGAEDAFVHTNTGDGTVRITFTVAAGDGTAALAIGAAQVATAVSAAGFVLQSPTATAAELVPA